MGEAGVERGACLDGELSTCRIDTETTIHTGTTYVGSGSGSGSSGGGEG